MDKIKITLFADFLDDLQSDINDIYDSDDFTIEVKGIDTEIDKRASKTLELAMKDMKDKESFTYRNFFLPFLNNRKRSMTGEETAWTAFCEKLIKGYFRIYYPDYNEKVARLDAYVKGEYFGFSIPKTALRLALTDSEADMLCSLPRPGFTIMELGEYNVLNFVLPAFYEYLVSWCNHPDNPEIRDLTNWMVGPK